MIKKIFILFLLIRSCVLFAQDNLADSISVAWELRYSNSDSAKVLLNKYLQYAQKNSKKTEAKIYSYLGVIEDLQGNGEKAIQYLLKALKIQESKYIEDISFTYNNLGIAYFFQYNYPKALEYYNLSYETDEKLGDKSGMAGTLVNMGIIYTYTDSITKAIETYNRASEIYQNLKDSAGIASVLNNIGKLEFGDKFYLKAIDTYKKSLLYSVDIKNPEIIFSTYYGLSNCFLKLNDLRNALLYANDALYVTQKYNVRERMQYGYELLAEIYQLSKDFNKAFAYLKKYTLLRDSLLNEDKNRKIAEMQTLYETEKKDKLITKAQLEKKLLEEIKNEQEKKIDKQQNQRNLLIIVLFTVLLILFVLVYAYRTKQKNNMLLKERNKAINENLIQKETHIGEIHHRVKNNLQLINSILDLQSRNITNEDIIRTINDIKHRIHSMSIIHQKLYSTSNIYGVNMEEYIPQLCEAILQSSKSNNQTILFEYHIQPLQLHIDTSIPLGLIITELITNALKYAFADSKKGVITISLCKMNDIVELYIADNGVGLSKSVNIEESKSFGLKMVKSLCRQLKAEMILNRSSGTNYLFKIKNFKTA